MNTRPTRLLMTLAAVLALSATALAATHTVVQGDTLWLISQKHNTTVSTLMGANNLTSTLLYPGQVLTVPSTGTYVVKAGDNLYRIALNHGTTMTELMLVNGLTSTLIYPGQALRLPASATPARDQSQVQPQTRYGEYLHWSQAQHLVPRGGRGTLTDFRTGITVNFVRRGGYNHMDIEPLTRTDTQNLHRMFNYSWMWNARAVLVHVNGRAVAAALRGMPHGGQLVSTNGVTGHFCLHYYGSKTHANGGVVLSQAQAQVRLAAGR